jgi:hypothetical protein
VEVAPEGARIVADRMAAAALAWLDTLTDEQRAVAVGAGPMPTPSATAGSTRPRTTVG